MNTCGMYARSNNDCVTCIVPPVHHKTPSAFIYMYQFLDAIATIKI